MNRQQQQRHSRQNCQICHKSVQADRLVAHQTQCLMQQRERRTQQQQQQQSRQQYYQQQRQPQQRINNSHNHNRNYNIQYSQDSSDSDQDGMVQFPNFNQIFGPNSQFQRSMDNMRHQMNEAFNINLNFGSDSFQFNLQTNGGQRQHIQIRNIGPGIQVQQVFNMPNVQFYYGDDDDDDEDENYQENQFYQDQEPEVEERRQAQPMRSSEIKQIPTQKYIPNQKNLNCVVCMIDFKKSDNVKILECFHQFHAKCIDQWLKQKGECPVCRHQLN
ncbi:unnamed protein product [Paramecium primaurelia]|uniref:RING-type domain-containing protein n=2 Tax=Paramecium TaxID=5884 RepID=A0A8S1TSD1_9CILI|nr:unnamed protein product [Paramecium primaurelia]CAD8154432.1 unnamed protein product [Paramecium pentaurelia]